VSDTVAEVEEEDTVSPIVIKTKGPRFGVETYVPGGETSFVFLEPRTNTPSSIEPPAAIKVSKEGGANTKIELYYAPGHVDIALSRFDDKTVLIKYGVNEETGKTKGKAYSQVVCSGRFRDKLPAFGDLRLTKYVCHTSSKVWFDQFSGKSLSGLGAPIEKGA
tara:strand:+ start:1013 stop:1501 length:489 start_codon:yes stop_codon:yes gene_type:complete